MSMFLILIRTVSTFSLPEIPTQNITKKLLRIGQTQCGTQTFRSRHYDLSKTLLQLMQTRYAIGAALKTLLFAGTFWSSGMTKFNRTQQGYPKATGSTRPVSVSPGIKSSLI